MELIIPASLALLFIILFLILPRFFPNIWDSKTNYDIVKEEITYQDKSQTKLASVQNISMDDQALSSIYEMEIEENLALKKIVFIFQTMVGIAKIDGDETPQERKFLELIILDLYKTYDFNDSIPQAQWIHSEKDDAELLFYNQILIDKLNILEKQFIISLMGDVALCDDTFTFTEYGAILNTCVKLGVKHNKELFNVIDKVETRIIEKHPSKFDKKTLKEYKSILLSPNDNGGMGYLMAEKFIYEKENAKNRRTS